MLYDENDTSIKTKKGYVKVKLKVLDDFGITDANGDIKRELLALPSEQAIDHRCRSYIMNKLQ